jgi:hypothetical protein
MTLSGLTLTGWTKHDWELYALQSQRVCNRLLYRMVRHATHSPMPVTASVGLAHVAHGPRTSGRETAAPQRTASGIGIASRHFGNASDTPGDWNWTRAPKL